VPFVLGMLLGPMVEENFRRAMLLSRGDPVIFVARPVSMAFLAITLLVVVLMFLPKVRRQKDLAVEE
jgi:TctA family transporter